MMSTMFVEMKKGVSVEDLRQHLVDRFQVNCISLGYFSCMIFIIFSVLNSMSVLLQMSDLQQPQPPISAFMVFYLICVARTRIFFPKNHVSNFCLGLVQDEEFVVVLQKGIAPHTRHVRGSNYCLLNVFEDRIPGRAIIISVVCYIFFLVKLKLFKATGTFDLNNCSSYWCNPWTGDKQFMDSIGKVVQE